MTNCVFCCRGRKNIIDSGHFIVRRDKFPVNKGHVLIISRRHVQDVFGLTQEEFLGLHIVLEKVKKKLDRQLAPAGYNIGANCGIAAGQTIFHFHLHVIPRYIGDVKKPRGGIRNFKRPIIKYSLVYTDFSC
jgi:diadenosine tetraphosphate (Ap4A) HIT family hydrolase